MRALVKIPDVNLLVRSGKLPDELTNVAMQFATTGIDVKALTGAEIREFVRLTYELIADALQYLAPPGSDAWDDFRESGDPVAEGWEPISLSGAELAEMRVDQGDLEALGQIAGRTKTPNEVTALSRFDRGLLTEEGVKAALTADTGERVTDYATFRREPAIADARPDGGDVRAAAVGADGSPGPGGRAGRRRSGRT